MKTLVIQMSKWSRGKATCGALLSKDSGKMCCLGFLAKDCGATDEQILEKSFPSDVYNDGHKDIKWPKGTFKTFYHSYGKGNSEVIGNLAWINDSATLSLAERKKQIRAEFKSLDYKVVFK